jgi:hypothetical protein
MADVQTYEWDQVDVDENVTETDLKQADNLGTGSPVGKFLCTLEDITARENQMKAYTCMAADLKLRIDRVIELEQPLVDEKTGQVIKRNNEVVMKRAPVKPEKQAEADAVYGGQYLYDTVNLANPKEKPTMKNRRLFVAKRLNIITDGATVIPTRAWPGAKGRQVIITTEWNHWEDKVTGEKKKNVKVAFDGYDFPGNNGAGKVSAPPAPDFSNI